MYELNSKKSKNIYLLFLIMALVAFFTVIAYTLILDNKKYEYSSNIVAKTIVKKVSEESSIEDILEDITESTVGISKVRDIGTTVFLEHSVENLNLGSGIIISEKGYILTNAHVAGDVYSICYITLKNGVTDNGTVIWSNNDLDLAIVKTNIKNLPVIELGDSDNIRLGTKVYAIGNPLGYELQRTVTSGIISGIDRTIKVEDGDKKTYFEGLLQTDATINEGNSGGALINEYGEVLGITTLKIEESEGIGFAIPINIIKPIIKKLNETGKFEEPYIGIYGYDKEAVAYLSQNIELEKGIYIEEIDTNGPLKNSNIIKGDILEEIDRKKVETMNDLKKYIYEKNIGDEVTLKIKRNKKNFEVKIKLEKLQ